MKFLKRMTGIILACSFSIALATGDESAPIPMLKTTANQVIAALKKDHLTLQKNPKLVYPIVEKILLPQVDTDRMAKMVLGRNVWTQITPTQREHFSSEFVRLVVNTYASALANYTDEEIRFMPLRDSLARKRIQVSSQIIRREGPPILVAYRLHNTKTGWKVYDLIVEGVSLIQSYQSQFRAEIANNGFDKMLANLHQHNRS